MTLNDEERKELEYYKKYFEREENRKRAKARYGEGVLRGGLIAILQWNLMAILCPDTISWRSIKVLGLFASLLIGIISNYYGPLRRERYE